MSDAPKDPKEAMREALERKKASQHITAAGGDQKDKAAGGPHGKAAQKRQFRRKAGG